MLLGLIMTLGVLVDLSVVEGVSNSCNLLADCWTCTKPEQHMCKWCPLDEACFGSKSTNSSCSSLMFVTKQEGCFNGSTVMYDPKAAVKYSILSSAAYTEDPQKCINKKLSSEKIELLERIEKKCLNKKVYGTCSAYTAISHASKQVFLVYRGSDSTKQVLAELVFTLIRQKVLFMEAGYVSKYFYDAFMNLYPCIKESINETLSKNPTYDLLVTGHSLGAAMASLAAVALVKENIINPKRLLLYNFGSPRVGDILYALNHDRLVPNSYRVVHFDDIIVHFPPMKPAIDPPYHHKTEVFYPKAMVPDSQYTVCRADEDRRCTDQFSPCLLFRCVLDLNNCLQRHSAYFNMKLSQYCMDVTDEKNKTESLRYNGRKSLSADTCTRIPA